MDFLSKKLITSVSVMLLIAFTLLGFNLTSRAKPQEKETVESQLKKVFYYYMAAEFDSATILAKGLFKIAQTKQDSIGIYEMLSLVSYTLAGKYIKQGKEYLRKIIELDPKNCELPKEYWPDEMKHTWYSYQSSVGVLSKTCAESVGIQTIAVLDFENASIADYEKMEPLSKGLSAFFVTDLKKVTKLRIVEREKVNYIIDELERGKTISLDKETAVRIGKMVGAHSMVFGTFMKLDAKHMRVDARVVKTETGEIFVTESQEGSPNDISKLEKNLALKIAEGLDIALSKKEKEEIELGGAKSLEAANLFAQGLKYQDKFDYKKAYECYKKAVEKDPNYTEAKRKTEILKLWIGL